MFKQLGVKEEKDADEEAEEALRTSQTHSKSIPVLLSASVSFPARDLDPQALLAAAQRAASQLTMAQCLGSEALGFESKPKY